MPQDSAQPPHPDAKEDRRRSDAGEADAGDTPLDDAQAAKALERIDELRRKLPPLG